MDNLETAHLLETRYYGRTPVIVAERYAVAAVSSSFEWESDNFPIRAGIESWMLNDPDKREKHKNREALEKWLTDKLGAKLAG